MKTRKNLVIVAILIVTVPLANLAFAQRPANTPQRPANTPQRSVNTAKQRAALRAEVREMILVAPKAGQKQELGQRQQQYSQEQTEQVRSALLDLTKTLKDLGELAPGNFDPRKLEEATSQIAELPYEHLAKLRDALKPSVMREKLAEARTTVSEFKVTLENRRVFETQSKQNQ